MSKIPLDVLDHQLKETISMARLLSLSLKDVIAEEATNMHKPTLNHAFKLSQDLSNLSLELNSFRGENGKSLKHLYPAQSDR